MLGDLSEAGMEETRRLVAEKYPKVQCRLQKLDITDEASVDNFYASAIASFSRIDYAANVAGAPQRAVPIPEISEATFDKQYAVNQKGVSVNACR